MALLRRRPVTGGDIFDLLIIATMKLNGISRIYTFSTRIHKISLCPVIVAEGRGPKCLLNQSTLTSRTAVHVHLAVLLARALRKGENGERLKRLDAL
jgi:hypothetical protein